MHARGWIIGAVVGLASTAAAEPAPKPVDVEALKSQGLVLVLQDAQGGVYVVLREDPSKEPLVFYGPNTKAVYAQDIFTWHGGGKAPREIVVRAPRVPGRHLASLEREKDGTYHKRSGWGELSGPK